MPDINAIKADITAADEELAKVTEAYKAEANDANAKALTDQLSKIKELNAALTKAYEESDPLSTDIEKRIEQVRKEEKEKLYSRQESLEEEKKALEEKVKNAEERAKLIEEQSKAELEKALKEAQTKKPGEGEAQVLDQEAVNSAIEEALSKYKLEAEKEQAAIRAEADAQVAALQNKLAKQELDSYKEKIIQDANGKIISDMVVGSSKEELDNAAIRARQAYERVFKEAAATRAGVEDDIRGLTPTPPNAGGNIGQMTGELTADQIRAMSPEEWKTYRAKLGLK